jgi:hypothetical protein
MKKSRAITLGLMNGVIVSAVTACGPTVVPVDPCNVHTFNPPACQAAISQHGYYYSGQFYPIIYHDPFDYYYGSYNTYIARGGRVYAAPATMYVRTYVDPGVRAEHYTNHVSIARGTYLSSSRTSTFSASRGGVTSGRGGFGAIGSSHSFGIGG